MYLTFVVTYEVTATESVVIPLINTEKYLKKKNPVTGLLPRQKLLPEGSELVTSVPFLWPQGLEGNTQPSPRHPAHQKPTVSRSHALTQFRHYFWIRQVCFLHVFPASNRFPSSKRPEGVERTEETSDVAVKAFAAKTWLSTLKKKNLVPSFWVVIFLHAVVKPSGLGYTTQRRTLSEERGSLGCYEGYIHLLEPR